MQPDKSLLRLLTEKITRAERSVVDGRQCVQRTVKRVQESLFILGISREMRERARSGKPGGRGARDSGFLF